MARESTPGTRPPPLTLKPPLPCFSKEMCIPSSESTMWMRRASFSSTLALFARMTMALHDGMQMHTVNMVHQIYSGREGLILVQ